MKGIKQYFFHTFFFLLVSCGLFFVIPSEKISFEMVKNEGWEVYYDGGRHNILDMPKYIDNALEISFINKVESIGPNQVLSFQTIQSEVYIYSDNKLLYEFKSPIKISKTPGNKVHIIELPESNENHQIEIVIKPIYNQNKFAVPTFIMGHVAEVSRYHIRKSILSFALSAILFMLGLIVTSAWVMISRRVKIEEDLLWLGLFAMMISCWLMLETQLISYVFGNHLFWSWITILVLKAAINPLTKFAEVLYGIGQKQLYYLRIASSTDIFFSIILQILGIVDLRETVIVTQCIFVIGVVIGIHAGIESYKTSSAKSELRKVHSYGLAFLGGLVGLDILCYYIMPNADASRFTRVGLLIYTWVLGGYVLLDIISLLKAEERAELLSELAWVDSMTKVNNRNAFEQHISSISHEEMLDTSVIVFDLNNLKYVNDTYGHRMGDYYITVASEFIKEVFGLYGSIYRIGGDEFCAITKYITYEEFKNLRNLLNTRLESLHGKHFEGKMEIAIGFAEFDKSKDDNLQSTMQRADENMYSNKELLKKQ